MILRSHSKPRPTNRYTPRLEGLEDRCVLSTGILDPSFDGDGIVSTPISGYAGSAINAILTQADGKIVATGNGLTAGNDPQNSFPVARYLPNGQLDPTFGTAGIAITNFAANTKAIAHAVAQQEDKLVVAGWAENNFALVRFHANGTLDATFGNQGKVTTDFDGGSDWADAMIVLPDQKILVAGSAKIASKPAQNVVGGDYFALARYLPDGTLDPSFGQGGKVVSKENANYRGRIMAIALQSEKIIAGGPGVNYTCMVARYDATGALDATFGVSGLTFGNNGGKLSGSDGRTRAVAIQEDGKIVTAGDNGVASARIRRYHTDGSEDASFGVNGLADIPPLASTNINAVTLQADGKILAAGFSKYASTKHQFTLLRLGFDPAPPTLSISDVTAAEGKNGTTTLFTFTVTLSFASSQTVTVNYATADDTAVSSGSAKDYTAQSGTLTFAPGQTTKTISIVVIGDKKKEANETFFVNLSGALNANLLDSQGQGTILNDD